MVPWSSIGLGGLSLSFWELSLSTTGIRPKVWEIEAAVAQAFHLASCRSSPGSRSKPVSLPPHLGDSGEAGSSPPSALGGAPGQSPASQDPGDRYLPPVDSSFLGDESAGTDRWVLGSTAVGHLAPAWGRSRALGRLGALA